MKKFLLLTTIVALSTTMALSQNTSVATDQAKPDTKKTSALEWENKLKTELQLTTDQLAKWEALNKEYQPKLDLVMNSDMTDEAKKQKKKEIKQEKEVQFMQLLTPEQQGRYKLMMENKQKEAEKKKQSGS